MNDILDPISRRYRVNLQTGVGELSITRTHELFEKRVRQVGRPVRIGYLFDFDPGGQSMPVAVSRKLEFFLRSHNGGNHDVKLFPLVLSLEEIKQYKLPRTPIKDSESRKDKFEERFGDGATELDALEALHPGTLETIVCEWIDHYYDHGLEARVEGAKQDLESELNDVRQAVLAKHNERSNSSGGHTERCDRSSTGK